MLGELFLQGKVHGPFYNAGRVLGASDSPSNPREIQALSEVIVRVTFNVDWTVLPIELVEMSFSIGAT